MPKCHPRRSSIRSPIRRSSCRRSGTSSNSETAPDPEGIRVRGLVPGQFEAYVRILHPAWADESRERHVKWAEIAAASGARLDGTVSFRRITVSPGSDIPLGPQGTWDEDATPMTGALPEEETNALLNLLTPSGVCWFVLWEGWDGLRLDPKQVSVLWHGNPHLVYRGPIEVIPRFEWSGRWQIPHLWFADDRTWCVGSDIEAYDTYVGGSVDLVERIVAAPELEALPVHPEDLAIVLGEWASIAEPSGVHETATPEGAPHPAPQVQDRLLPPQISGPAPSRSAENGPCS